MADTHWLDLVKKAAVRAVKAEKPCDYVAGTVVSENPLRIKISEGDGLELEADFLHLARNVTDYEATVSISADYGWNTAERGGGSDYLAYESHNHGIEAAEKRIKVHNALKQGEKVLMIRKWGGQDYIVIDRVVS